MAVAVASTSSDAVALNGVQYAYPGCSPFIRECSIVVPRGSRCLLVGCNGAGKTTLLQIVAGKYMVRQESIYVLGRSPFHDLVRRSVGDHSHVCRAAECWYQLRWCVIPNARHRAFVLCSNLRVPGS
jgi:CCR4-NOT complex subunit CAF16